MNVKEYKIKTIAAGQCPLSVVSSVWDLADVGYVDCQPWSGYHPAPKTTFRLLRDSEGLNVLFHSCETGLRAEVSEENGPVYQDSCVEFFFKPDNSDERYINFEINPKGVMHIGLGEDRYVRQLLDEPRETFCIESDASEGDWLLKFHIPDKFILKYFDKITDVMRGNFYKCGELTGHSHFATWAPVDTDRPDFHRPEFFGKLVTAD